MATRLFFRSTTDNTAGFVSTEKSTVLPVGTSNQSGAVARDLSTTAGTSAVTGILSSLAQTAHQDGFFRKFISPQLSVSSITAQTWTLGVSVNEGNNAANVFIVCSVYVLTSADTVRGFIYDSDTPLGTEWATGSVAGRVVTFSGSAVSGVVSTDRLVVEFWYHAVQSMGNSYSHDFSYNGATDIVDGVANTDPASYIETPQDGLFAPPAITGSSAVTEGDDTSSASGTFDPPLFTGTSAVSETADTSAASGTFVTGPISGSGAPSEIDDTSAASGTFEPPPITGTAGVSETDDTSAASGTFQPPTFTATATPTEGDDTSTASGTFTPPSFIGTSAAIETDDSSAASGTFTPAPITGSAAASEDDDTASGSGNFASGSVTGSATPTEGDDTATASGTFVTSTFTGSAAVTEQDDTATANGTFSSPPITGTANPNETDDTLSAVGTFTYNGVTGIGNPTEEPDTLVGVGSFTSSPVVITGIMVKGAPPRARVKERIRIQVKRGNRIVGSS